MTKTKISLAALLLLCTIASFSQTISPVVAPSQGAYTTGGNLQLQYTIGEPINQTLTGGGYQVSLGFQQPEMNITVGTMTGSPFCAGTQISIPFTPQGIYGAANTFTAQLSDSSGSFASPVTIGVDSVPGYDTIIAALPSIVTGGSHYRVRVVASSPGFIGGQSGSFNILTSPTNITPTVSSDTICPGRSTVVNLVNSQQGILYLLQQDTSILYVGAGSGDSVKLITPNIYNNITLVVSAQDTSTGCSIQLTPSISLAVNSLVPPSVPDTVYSYSDSAFVFTLPNLLAPGCANQIEWASSSDFSSSQIISSPGLLSFMVTEDTVFWFRSKDNVTGLVSTARSSILLLGRHTEEPPPPPSTQCPDQNGEIPIDIQDMNGVSIAQQVTASNGNTGTFFAGCGGIPYTFIFTGIISNAPNTSSQYTWALFEQDPATNVYNSLTSASFNNPTSASDISWTPPPVILPGSYEISLQVTLNGVPQNPIYISFAIFPPTVQSTTWVTYPPTGNCWTVSFGTSFRNLCYLAECDDITWVESIQKYVLNIDGNPIYTSPGQAVYCTTGNFDPSSSLTTTFDQNDPTQVGFHTATINEYNASPPPCNTGPTIDTYSFQFWIGPPQVTLTAATSVICNGALSSSIIQSQVNLNGHVESYQWASSDGSFQASGAELWSVSVSPTATTNYYLTVTDSYGCTGSASITINVINCCQGDPITSGTTTPTYTFNSGASCPSLSFILANNPELQNPALPITVALNGNFPVAVSTDITSTVSFQNIIFLMGSNTRIEVEYRQELNLIGCTLKGCANMWDGIYVGSEAQLFNMQNGLFEDAVNGITINSNSNVPNTIINNQFYRNYTSINLINNTNNPIIRNNTFDFLNTTTEPTITAMLPESDGTTPYTRPLFGIKTINSTVSIPDVTNNPALGNTFQKINCGIFALESTVSSYNNTFNNIANHETPNYLGTGGSGIFALNGLTGPDNLNTLTAIGDNYTGCTYGDQAIFSAAYIANGNYSNCNYGVYTRNSQSYVSVFHNQMQGVNFGITLNNNYQVNQNVWDNTIMVNEPVSYYNVTTGPFGPDITITLAPGYYGIGQTDVIGTSSCIFLNHIHGGQSCIALKGVNGTQVFYNHVYQDGQTPVQTLQAGIYSSNSQNLKIGGNYLDGNNSATYNTNSVVITSSKYRKSGIYLNSSLSATICGNYVAQTSAIGYGMYFAGNGMDVNVWNNQFNTNGSKYAMELEADGAHTMVAPVQAINPNMPTTKFDNGNNGNGWIGPFSGNSLGASNTIVSGFYNGPIFYYNSTATAPVNNFAPAVHEQVRPDLAVGCSAIGCPALMLGNIPGFELKFAHNLIHEAVATGYADTLMEPGYLTTGAWLAQRNLYAVLCDSTPPIPGPSSLPAGLAAYLTAFIDTTTDTLLVSGAAELLSQIISGDTTSGLTDSLTVDTLVANFFAASQTSDFNAIQAVLNQVKALNDSSLRGNQNNYKVASANAYSQLNNVPATNAQDVNFVNVMTAYLTYAAPGSTQTIDTLTLNMLDSIALLCPYLGGDAVYYARALLVQFGDTTFYDDIQLCPIDSTDTTSGGSLRALVINNTSSDTMQKSMDTATRVEFAQVYPNPAKQIINLAYLVNTNGNVEFDLINALGVTVIQQALDGSQNFAQFGTSSLSNGLYYWVLKGNITTIKTGKVAIVK